MGGETDGSRSPFRLLALILLLAAGARALHCFGLSAPGAFYEYDGEDYADVARNLAEGRGYSISWYRWFEPYPAGEPGLHPDIYRPPLLPAVGAALHSLPGPWEIYARLFQVLAGTACVLLVYLLTRRLFGRRCALLAAAGAAVYPYAVYYSAKWSTETLFCLLVLASLCAALRLRDGRRLLLAALTGVLAGLACLARPNGLIVAVGLAVWTGVCLPRGRRALSALLVLAGVTACVVPWSVRNYRAANVIAPVTAFGPYNLWLGNNDRMYRMYRAGHSRQFVEQMDKLYKQDSRSLVARMEARGITEPARTARFWTDRATIFMRERPGKTASIWLHRAWHYWRPWPNAATAPGWMFWLSALTVTPMFLLAVLGIAQQARRTPAGVSLLLLPPLLGLLAALPFVFHLRLRYPLVDLPMLILAAAGMVGLMARCKRPGRSEAGRQVFG